MQESILQNTDVFSMVINVKTAAEIIGCTPGRVRQLLISGELPGEKLTQTAWQLRREDVEQYARHNPQNDPRRVGRRRISESA